MTDQFVPCPGCQATGQQYDVAELRTMRLIIVPCRCCNGTGSVTSQRVCPTCKKFRTVCSCKAISEYEIARMRVENEVIR